MAGSKPGELLTPPRLWLDVTYIVATVVGVVLLITPFYQSVPLPVYFGVMTFSAFMTWSAIMVMSGFYMGLAARVVGALLFPVTLLERLRGIEMGPSWLWELLIGALFSGLLYLGRGSRQKSRDEAATVIAERLRSGATEDAIPPFCLYLRPFEVTNRLPTQITDAGPGEKGEHVDLESLLADSLAPQYTLIALGKPGEIYGAGRWPTSDKTWREEFRRLAAAADFILLLPSTNPGTFEEITWLAEHGLDRCVWMTPAAVEPGLADTGQRERLESSWERARSACAELGLELPPYDARGLLFRLGPDGVVLATEPIAHEFRAKAGLRRALYRLWLG